MKYCHGNHLHSNIMPNVWFLRYVINCIVNYMNYNKKFFIADAEKIQNN